MRMNFKVQYTVQSTTSNIWDKDGYIILTVQYSVQLTTSNIQGKPIKNVQYTVQLTTSNITNFLIIIKQ